MNQKQNLRFGCQAAIELPFGRAHELACFKEPHGASCQDPVAAVKAALAAPIDHPDLTSAIVPDDRVVIAIGQAIPQLDAVLEGVVDTLIASGVESRNIQILLGQSGLSENEAQQLCESWRGEIKVLRHDARDRMSVAYLAATAAGHPVYMNRYICDADLVITMGCVQPHQSPGYFGLYDAVYPAFADVDTIRRFYRGGLAQDSKRCRREAEEAGWLLGARFTIQVIPGAGDCLLHVLAGDIDSVAQRGSALAREAWSWQVEQCADLVIAAIAGGASQQTWQNLYRSLEAAAKVVEESGAVVVCCELSETIDEHVLQRLARHAPGRSDDEDEPPQLETVQPTKVIPGLTQANVYLLSQLADDLVEDLGMIPIKNAAEMARICARSQRTIVLENGQHVWPEVVSLTPGRCAAEADSNYLGSDLDN